MSTFEVLIEKVDDVYDHPNADRLSIVKIRGYQCISAKREDGSHRYAKGDLVIYCPEDSIIPEFLLRRGFWNKKEDKGMLAGKNGDRVKAIRLRQVLSQGIIFSVFPYDGFTPEAHYALAHFEPEFKIEVGANVAELLGITKFVPEIPENMGGAVTYIGSSNTLKFDVENIKKWPNVLPEGTDVVYEEKLHGTCFLSSYIPNLNNDKVHKGDFCVTSKGLSAQGIVLQFNEDNLEKNLYVRAFIEHELEDKLRAISNEFDNAPVYVLGEVFGKGVQDLHYSLDGKKFAVFGVFVGYPKEGRWLNTEEKYAILHKVGLGTPPILYKGPHSSTKLAELTKGKSAIDNVTVREGIVVTPTTETQHDAIGRVILKNVSEDYLLRKGNVTEYQ